MNFSKRSYHFAVISLVLMGVFLILAAVDRNGSTSLDDVIGYLITLFFVTVFIGFVCALLGIRESASYQKMIGLVVNVILMILLIFNVLQNLSSIAEVFS